MKIGHYATLAALNGVSAVVVGAFAAHAVHDETAKTLLDTGARYQFMHAMATFAALTLFRWGATRAAIAIPFFLVGIALFSGSLFAVAAGAPRWTGAITPFGGLAFLTGWAVLAWSGLQLRGPADDMGGQS